MCSSDLSLMQVFRGLIDFIVGVFTGNWERAWNGVLGVFRGIANTIISVFEGMINFIVAGINGIVGGINGALGAISDATGGAIALSVPTVPGVSLPRLADGGTVFPSRGGSIVNVAEAGRPERIEPLDENGLSNRDKALIDFLSGGAGAGITIQINQLPGEDMEELAERVSRILAFRMRRGSLT